MALTNAERQSAFRARKKACNQTPRTILVTDDEYWWLMRTLQAMRKDPGSRPAAMRNKKGHFVHLDA